MSVRAADAQSERQWGSNPFGSDGLRKIQVFRGNRAWLGIGVAASMLLFGWLSRKKEFLTADHGIGYALGVVSVLCMLVLLLYPLRKRYRQLKFLGPLPRWFRNHMVLGVTAPIAALYHCNFTLGSLNSRIALFSALSGAASARQPAPPTVGKQSVRLGWAEKNPGISRQSRVAWNRRCSLYVALRVVEPEERVSYGGSRDRVCAWRGFGALHAGTAVVPVA